jgi:hypothetical protein
MKGDFTRNTHDPKKHYRDVLMQQGRVQVDADFNEQAALTARRDETTTADIIGDCGGPADNAAFGVFTDPSKLSDAEAEHLKNLNIISPLAGGDFFLSAGRYYVDGIQCENEWPTPFSAQPDRRGVGPLEPGAYLLYLDVWQRHVTALEDSSIREPALGGPDHGTRAKTIWQVGALNFGPAGASDTDNPCGLGADLFSNLADRGTAKLTAGTAAQQAPKDPCLIPASAGYTGLENQLYRVEIHGPGRTVFAAISADDVAGDTEVTTLAGSGTLRPRRTTIWKWSRENGSVVTRIEKIDGNKITVSSLGPDKNLGFAKDAWVEILDDALELESNPGQLAQVDDVDEANRIITLKTAVSSLAPSDPNYPNGIMPELHPKLRRWEGVASIQFGTWLPLESGVQVNFATGNYRTGHYWQIPARTATAQSPTGDIEWPLDSVGNRAALSPFGITHHFCRLGIVDVKDDGSIEATDCRCLWPALTTVPRLFYVSGDGQEVMPDLTDTTGKRYKLPRPLIVGLGNGQCAPPGTKVRFSVIYSPNFPHDGRVAVVGTTAPTGQIVDVPLGADGMASCDFHLDGTHYTQQVRAQLLDAAGVPCSLPIIFNATLSIASEVAYDPGECVALQDKRTVQDAISGLAALVRIDMVAGDGQDTDGGQPVPDQLIVRVSNACGPVQNAIVAFTVFEGFVAEDSAHLVSSTQKSIPVSTNGNGIAECRWRTATAPGTQQLRAEITGLPTPPQGMPGLAMGAHHLVLFTANLRPGKDCCVTVGAGGDFATLETAVTTLLGLDAQEICICLLPGDHIVPAFSIVGATASAQPATGGTTPAAAPIAGGTTPAAVPVAGGTTPDALRVDVGTTVATNIGTPPSRSPIALRHLHIHGCGRASRILLKTRFQASGLSSLTLADLGLYADKAQNRPIQIKDCDDVTITGCHVRNQDTDNTEPTDLVTISHETQPEQPPRRRRTHIANNVIECEGSIDLSNVAGGVVTAGNLAAGSQMVVETAVSNLASRSKSQRTAFVKEFRKIVKDTPKSDPNKEVLEAALKRVAATPRSARETQAATPVSRPSNATVTSALPLATTPEALAAAVSVPDQQPVRTIFGPALVIADADADTSITNNIIAGEVRIYGTGSALSEEEFENLATRIHKPPGLIWDTTSTSSTRSLRIEGNSLTNVVVSRDIVPREGASTLQGLFARMSLLDNTFHAQGSEWLALHVISNGNYFLAPPVATRRIQLMATAVAASFICVGTSARWIASTLQYAVPPGDAIFPASTFFSQSANLFIALTPL